MNCFTSLQAEGDWLRAMKKELLEDTKDKEVLYNFDFECEKAREGRLAWERTEASPTATK